MASRHPTLGSSLFSFDYQPFQGNWIYTANAGIAAQGSAFNPRGVTNGNSDGTTSTSGQVGFIEYKGQQIVDSAISQNISGFGAGTFTVTFSIEDQRTFGANPIDVKLDSQDLGTFTALSGTSFNTVTTASFPVTAGTHTLAFIGRAPHTFPADYMEFIDTVSITNVATPEPATASLVASGVLCLAGYYWLRRKCAVA